MSLIPPYNSGGTMNGGYRADGSWASYDNYMPQQPTAQQQKFQATVEEGLSKAAGFLKDVFTNALKHKTNIVLGALLNGTNAVTNIHRFGKAQDLADTIVAGINVGESFINKTSFINPTTITAANALFDELKNPNIGGIPIHADTETESSDADVSQHLVINQVASNKEYRTDNIVPKPRTWSIKGYLMATRTTVDSSLVIKPGLLAQRKLLQYYKDARLPCVFKTHDNRFFTVLITHFDTSYTVQSLNSLAVNIQLIEYQCLSIETDTVAASIFDLKSGQEM